MTALTPQQMRELAEGRRTWMWHGDWDEEAEIALRANADQLDAVRTWVDEHYHHFPEISELDAILTADTTPQEDRDD